MTEKPVLISKEKAKRPCRCWGKKLPPTKRKAAPLVNHTKLVFSDGWTRWVCSNCGKVGFTFGMENTEEEVVN